MNKIAIYIKIRIIKFSSYRFSSTQQILPRLLKRNSTTFKWKDKTLWIHELTLLFVRMQITDYPQRQLEIAYFFLAKSFSDYTPLAMFRNDKRQDENASQSVWNSLSIVCSKSFLLTIVLSFVIFQTSPLPPPVESNITYILTHLY